MKKPSKPFLFAAKGCASLGFVVWLAFKVQWRDALAVVHGIDPGYVAAYLFFLLCSMVLSARKWQVIARSKGFGGRLRDYFRAYLSGTFINNFLPSFIGGDAYRSYWLGRGGGAYSSAFSTVVLDRLTGLWAASLLTLFFSFFFFEKVLSSPVWLFFDLVLAGGVMALALGATLSGPNGARRILPDVLPARAVRILREVAASANKAVLGPSLGYALAFNVVGIGLANLCLFYALGSRVPTLSYFSVVFLVSIVSSIPVSINNIGIKEWAYYTFFGLFGMNSEVAVTAAIIGRFVQMLVSFFALPAYLRERREIAAIRQ
jgi:uncharacterized membrane protein YbhN (UPF0104 family)